MKLQLFSEANLLTNSLDIYFSVHVDAEQVIALGSSILGFSRPRVRDVTCSRKQVPIEAKDEIVSSSRFPRFEKGKKSHHFYDSILFILD